MKPNILLALTLLGAGTLFLAGCNKSETTDSALPTAESEKSAVTDAASKAATAIKEGATEAAATVKEQASQATAAVKEGAAEAGTQATALIEKAKTFVANKQYKEALTSLQEAGALKLTAEQQKLIDDLKKQASAALASSGLGGVLGGSKQ